MFLAGLNEPQKRTFLTLASRITQADGEDSQEEQEALEELCSEMDIKFDIDMSAVLGDIDVVCFDTHRSRVVAGLELMRLVYADDFVHEAEVAEVSAICHRMNFPYDWITMMSEWARRLSWSEDAPEEPGRRQYKDQLIAFAEELMEMKV